MFLDKLRVALVAKLVISVTSRILSSICLSLVLCTFFLTT